MNYDTTLIPVFDAKVTVTNHFTKKDDVNQVIEDITYQEAREKANQLAKNYPQSDIQIFMDKNNWITQGPLEQQQDEENEMPFEEWMTKWYPEIE